MLLEDKIAIVTGAGQGIGRAIALALARAGANLSLSDVVEEGMAETARLIGGLGRAAICVQGSVTEPEDVNRLVKATVDRFQRLDILVNNAGITRDNLLVRMTDEEWTAVLDVNLRGVFNCCRAAIKQMLRQKSGVVINIASVVGLLGNPGQANYVASKAGVIGLTKALAREYASRGIRVNAIAPGFIQSAMTDRLPEAEKKALASRIPLVRLGTPEDVAGVAVFLASEAASYMTGQVLSVDGGMAM